MLKIAVALAGLAAVGSSQSYFVEAVSASTGTYQPMPAAKTKDDAPCVRYDLAVPNYARYVCEAGSTISNPPAGKVTRYVFGDDKECLPANEVANPEEYNAGTFAMATGYGFFVCDGKLDYLVFDLWAYGTTIDAVDHNCGAKAPSQASLSGQSTIAVNICAPTKDREMGASTSYAVYQMYVCDAGSFSVKYFIDDTCMTAAKTDEFKTNTFKSTCSALGTIPPTGTVSLYLTQEFVACHLGGKKQTPSPTQADDSDAARAPQAALAAVSAAGAAALLA